MRRALKDRLANYKIPQELKVLQDALPRNAMGKSECRYFIEFESGKLTGVVNKKNLVKEVFGDPPSS